jgi:hypothetical protein
VRKKRMAETRLLVDAPKLKSINGPLKSSSLQWACLPLFRFRSTSFVTAMEILLYCTSFQFFSFCDFFREPKFPLAPAELDGWHTQYSTVNVKKGVVTKRIPIIFPLSHREKR